MEEENQQSSQVSDYTKICIYLMLCGYVCYQGYEYYTEFDDSFGILLIITGALGVIGFIFKLIGK